jgi:tetratricopeptide (TPR) repeat protein
MNNQSLNCKAVAVAVAVALAIVLSACGSSTPESYVASARTYLARNDYPAAIIELKNALKADPNQADARLLLAKALIDGGNPRDAETEARKVIELNYLPEQAVPLLLRTLLLQGEFRKLVAEPYDGKSVQPAARAEIDTLRSLAYLALGDREAARTALESALSVDKEYAPAKMVQVRLAVAHNDLPAALELVDAILAAAPSEIEALIIKSDVQIALGRRDDGIRTLQRASPSRARRRIRRAHAAAWCATPKSPSNANKVAPRSCWSATASSAGRSTCCSRISALGSATACRARSSTRTRHRATRF